MLASGSGALDVMKVLLDHNAKVNAVNAQGDTPLHFAVRQNQQEAVDLLLRNAASVDARNKEGVTPLMVAAWSGFDNLVQQLLSAGADTELVDEEGVNAASHARSVHDPAAREVILKLLGA